MPISEDFYIEVEYEFFKPEKNLLFSIIFYAGEELFLYTSESDKKGMANDYEVGKYSTIMKVPAFTFNIGYFHFEAVIHSSKIDLDCKEKINFEIINLNNPKSRFRSNYELGKSALLLDYNTKNFNHLKTL